MWGRGAVSRPHGSSYPLLISDRLKTTRNIATVALIAAAVYLLPSGGQVAQTGIGELLWFVLVGGIVYALIVVFRRWRAY